MRTLERLVASGKLKKGRGKGKTRPVVIFDKGDVERLKEELQSTRPDEVFRRLNTPRPKDAIGFRLDPFYVRRLEEEGAKRDMSPADFARRLVVRGLEVGDELASLRKSLGSMFYLILVSKLGASETEAEEIVRNIEGA